MDATIKGLESELRAVYLAKADEWDRLAGLLAAGLADERAAGVPETDPHVGAGVGLLAAARGWAVEFRELAGRVGR